MTLEEVQKGLVQYQLERNAVIAKKFANNKKFCALDDFAPDLTDEIMSICAECYDLAYRKAIEDIFPAAAKKKSIFDEI